MSTADQYRAMAAEFRAKAEREANPALRAHLESMVLSYLRLAEQAERMSRTDLVYATPPPKPGSASPAAVQHQPKPDETSDETQ